MNKKGQIELQFNWIYVMVAGGIILLVFAGVALFQKNYSDAQTKISLSTSLETIFITAGSSGGSSQPIPLSNNLEINFKCGEYSIEGMPTSSISQPFFSPNKIKGKELITWTQDFYFPYKSSTLLYLTSSELKYYFINSSSNTSEVNILLSKLNDFLPNGINKKIINFSNFSNIKDENNYQVKIVLFNDVPRNISNWMKRKVKDISVVLVNTSDTTVSFYKIDNSNNLIRDPKAYTLTYDQIGLIDEDSSKIHPILLAAIFSEPEIFRCSFQSIIERHMYIAEILQNRSLSIRDELGPSSPCGDLHNTATGYFEEIIANSKSCVTSLKCDILKFSNLIETNNVIRRQSCPTVY